MLSQNTYGKHQLMLAFFVSAKEWDNAYNYNIICRLDDNINKGTCHLLASLRELKVRKLVVTRDTEWGAL